MPSLTQDAAVPPMPPAARPAHPATGEFRLDLNVVASIYRPMAGRERRRSCRMPRHASVWLTPLTHSATEAPPPPTSPNGHALTAVLQDLSATGVGVLYGQPLPVGGDWAVGLPRPGGEPLWLRCEVMRVENVGDSL